MFILEETLSAQSLSEENTRMGSVTKFSIFVSYVFFAFGLAFCFSVLFDRIFDIT